MSEPSPSSSLSGYRTIIALVISLVLKALVLKGVLSSEKVGDAQVNVITDSVLLLASVVSDLAGVWFRMKAEKPGVLSEAAKSQREFELQGVDRREKPSGEVEPKE